ncbi:LysR family transcriptional regulator [Kribbella sp. NPDC026611]|uniref:LysR family transcriptional regulator n=1 Tax=Kribbella sp. NPDC026611 TaxID=3154911 RepID=UPI003403F453
MEPTIELRELRIFLVLADELHFGRTAVRLGLTQSSVSQSVRALERKLGGELAHRTSRRVTLTVLGEQLRAELQPAYTHLLEVLERARSANGELDGVLRLGIYGVAGGARLRSIVAAFEERYVGCHVEISDLPIANPLEPLRRGEVEVIAMRLPLDQPDLVVGPVLTREPRVLAVAADHPLAARDRVSIEDVADYAVLPMNAEPREMLEALIPRQTPGGRPIRRLPRTAGSVFQVSELIARGQIVHPTVPAAVDALGSRGIVYVPIADLPHSRTALVWRRRSTAPRLREFVAVAREQARRSSHRRGTDFTL